MAAMKLVTLGSTRETLAAESRLKAAGVPHRLIPTPPSINPDCGLAIAFAPGAADAVLGVLRESGMAPQGPFDFEPLR
jgi:hypothetical protein